MSDDLVVTATWAIPAGELHWRFSRSSGPGGQSVNTTDSRVELSYDVERSPALPSSVRSRVLDRLDGRLVDGVLTIAASEYRSQLRNRDAAGARLVAVLREAAAPPPAARRATRPSRAARAERVAAKRHRGDVKRLRRVRGEE